MATSTNVRPHPLPTVAAIPASVVAAAATGIAADAVIALIAHHLGAPRDFKPLQVGSFAALTVVGVLAGAIGWNIIRRRSGSARRVLTRLVPAVIALSLVPDLILGVARFYAHTTWGGVAALMLMHLAVAACAVTSYWFLLPLQRTAGPADHHAAGAATTDATA